MPDLNYKKLKSGTDVRGVAVATKEHEVELTDEAVFHITGGFAAWLLESGVKEGSRIAVGHDSRISAGRIKAQVIAALCAFGFQVVDCGLASTPAMFMTTVDFDCSGAVQITASHHPFDRNGLKFFTKSGGVDSGDLDRILDLAASLTVPACEPGSVETADYMCVYAKRLRDMICKEVAAEDYEHPLVGYHIVVDAGNGVGGFYASDVLAPLGADVSGSQFLEPDGMFPNHAPNPENKEAMASVSAATKRANADLGIIFDTDVDRASCVDAKGKEINRNRLVALASIIALENNPGGTIVTDSVTSTGLTAFINETLGGVHYRYKRGYRNVINKQMELIEAGINCPLAIETSGHAAFCDNFHLDDGAYLMTKIVIKMAQMGKQGKTLDSLIAALKDPVEATELRMKICCEDFRTYGLSVIEAVEAFAAKEISWRTADDNREGIRVYFDDPAENGWFLLRLSVHDPIMPLNIESDVTGGCRLIAKKLLSLLEQFDQLDLQVLREYCAEPKKTAPELGLACPMHKTSVGGQALIEGIMMQGPKGAALSVRLPNGEIDTSEKHPTHIRDKVKFLGWPIIRGCVNFVESMIFGYQCLMESAEKSGLEDMEQSEEEMSKLDRWLNAHLNKKVMSALGAVASVLGIALAFGLFFYLPTVIANFFNKLANGSLTNFRALLEGVLRMLIFVGYIAAVSLMKDIRRTFMYHGAEHKTIFCYEHGLELTVENVRKQSRYHPRCGTSFLFVIIIISVLISSIISVAFPALRNSTPIWMLVKLLILPLVMGFGYEFIKYAGKHDNVLVKILSAPGLWMQRLTTKEPDDDMIEVALAAFKAVITDDPNDDRIQ